jgi:hypothetical protein
MYLTIDIYEMAQPVVNDTKRVPLILKFLYFLKGRLVTKYNKHLTTFNLALEGAINRVDDISMDRSKKILEETKRIIVSMEDAEANLAKSNYFDSAEVKENIKYTLKCLYTFESKLHKQAYKSAPTIKIDKDLREGIAKMNASNIHELLSY